MSLAFYCYTLLILTACMMAASVCASAFLVTRRSTLMIGAAMFLLYMFKLAIIFEAEHLSQNIAFDWNYFYSITHPLLHTVFSAGFLTCLWLIICSELDEKRPGVLAAPTIVFFGARMLCVVAMSDGPWKQWTFYSLHQFYLLWIAGFAGVRYWRTEEEQARIHLLRYKKWYVAFCVISILILLEDTMNILVISPSLFNEEFSLYLSERNFFDNVLIVFLGAFAVLSSSKTLALRFERPPSREEDSVQRHIDDLLPLYASQHGLSNREAEVLRLLLLGKDNQNIANELTLALGTIKAHVHNILKKTGQPDRASLKRHFWRD
ncbi:helix-turn-helix transcriptional regulator [Slackia heliotrinireducens]|uniref:helix-turn-helix transcriptional regulator n=1 Tax=Slackia heliotrinireducens TaxID=84110 RepID=UPI0033162CCB